MKILKNMKNQYMVMLLNNVKIFLMMILQKLVEHMEETLIINLLIILHLIVMHQLMKNSFVLQIIKQEI